MIDEENYSDDSPILSFIKTKEDMQAKFYGQKQHKTPTPEQTVSLPEISSSDMGPMKGQNRIINMNRMKGMGQLQEVTSRRKELGIVSRNDHSEPPRRGKTEEPRPTNAQSQSFLGYFGNFFKKQQQP